MNVEAIARRWIDILTLLWLGWRERRRAQHWLKIVDDGDGLRLQQADGTEWRVLRSAAGEVILPAEIMKAAKRSFVMLAHHSDEIICRSMTVPAQARDLLPGIVRNQIERVSPWRAAQAAYGFDSRDSEDAANLDVRIMITPRALLDDACARMSALGLQIDAVVAGASSSDGAADVTLWSRGAEASGARVQRLRWVIGGAMIASVCIAVVVSVWAFSTAASATADSEEIGLQIERLQRQVRGGRSPQAIAALPQAERAWALKETSLVASVAIESLSRALPDGAYLTELAIEGTTVRLVGIAQDAPALIASLEQSGQFRDVHFSAATTRSADGARFIFHIEAQAEPRATIGGG